MNKPTHILIVEDKSADADLAKRTIRQVSKNCEFQVVETREGFLNALEVFQPELILSDYSLPRFDGRKALELVHKHAPLTPLIIWTGSISEDVAVECMKAGANNYILKDNIKRLGPAVIHALEERQLLLERKQAEEALQNSEKRFRSLIENGLDNISLLKADGTLIWESPAAIRMLDYAPDEFLGHDIFELMHPDDKDWTRSLYMNLIQEPGSHQRGTFRLRRSDNTWRWVDAIVTNMLNEPSVSAIVVNYRDITEQKLAEEALRESQAKYQNLVETSHDLIWSVDAQGKITFLNRAAKEIYGREPEELIGRSFFEIMDPQHYHRDSKIFKEAILQEDQFRSVESPVLRKDGKQIILSANSIVTRGNDGNVISITGTSHDITERKQMEEALREERNLLRTLIDNIPDRIYAMDRQGRKTLSNTADWKASGGKTMEDVIGKTDFDTYPLEMAEGFWQLDKLVLDSGQPVINHEESGLDPEGNRVSILTTKMPLRDSEGTVIGLVGVGRDITERKQVEEKLQLSDQILQRVSALVLVADPQGNIVYVSPAAKTILGYEPEELLGNNWWKLSRSVPIEAQIEKEYVGRAAHGEISIPTGAYERPIQDRWGNIHWISWVDTAGPSDLLIGVGHDITERRQAEARINDLLAFNEKILNHSPLGILTYKLTGECIFANENAARIVGSNVEILRDQNFRTIESWKKSGLYDLFEKAITTQSPVTADIHHSSTFGKDVWITAHCVTFKSKEEDHILLSISDITERKQAEEALRESENRLILALSGAQMSVWEWDLRTNSILWSPEFFEITGVREDEFGQTFESFTNLVHRDDVARVMTSAERAVNEQTLFTEEFRIIRPDGEIRWISNLGHAEYDSINNYLRLIGTVQDITPRKQAELERQALLEIMQGLANTTDLHELLELIHVSIAKVIYAKNFFVILYNEKNGLFEEIYSVDQYDTPATPSKLEKSITSYVFHSGEPLLLTQERFDELEARDEVTLVGTHSASWLGAPLKTSGRKIGVIAVQDYENNNRYSERDKEFLTSIASQIALAINHRQAVDAVRESEVRYRGLFENLVIGFALHEIITDEKGKPVDYRFLEINPAFEKLTGIEARRAIGNTVKELLPGVENDSFIQIYGKVALTGIPIHFEEFSEQIRKHYEINAYSPRKGQFAVTFTDITERKQAEIELQQKNDDLALLNAINEGVIRGQDLDSIVELLATEVSRIFSVQGNTIYSTIYMLTPDKQAIRIQKYFFSSKIANNIEKLIGFNIPTIEIPIKEGGHFHQAMISGQSAISSEPKAIQDWIGEFTETRSLPPLARVAIRKLIPKIHKILHINSVIVVPLIAEGETIGFWDVSSSSLFTVNDLKRIENIGGQLTAAIQRQLATEKVHRSEEFLQSIQNALSANIAILNESGTIVQVNSAWREFGEQNGLVHPDSCVGLNYLEICDSATGTDATEAALVVSAIRDITAGRRNEAIIEYPCHSPQNKRWFTLRITKFEDDDGTWIILAHENITERKQAENALHASEALYRQTMEIAGAVPYYESYYDQGRAIKYEFIGEGIRQITGYEPKEFSAALWDSLVEEVNLVEDLTGYSLDEGIERVRAGKNSIWKCEHRLRDRYGKIHWVFEAAVELRDENGVSHGSIGTYQDITTRKQAEMAEREQRALAEALRDTAETLSSTLDYGEVLDHILTVVGRVVPHDAATIMLIDGESARVVRSYGYDNRGLNLAIMGIRLPLAETNNLRQMIETRQPVIVDDTYTYPGWMRLEAIDWLRSNVGAPISIQDKIIGFIMLDNKTPGFFTPVHAERLEAFANQAAVAIHNADLLQQAQEEIAERKRVEESLQAEREKAQNYLDIAGVMMLALDRDGIVTLINQKGCEILGYPADEIIGKDWIKTFLPNTINEELQGVFRQLVLDDPKSPGYYENHVLTKNGEQRLIAWHNTQVRDAQGTIVSTLSSGEDITERKRAEAQLRASEERFRQLADNIEEAFWMTDAESGKEIYLSPAAEVIWERPVENLMDDLNAFMTTVFSEDQSAIMQAIEREKSGEKVEIEYRIIRPDGSLRWVWDRAFPIFDEEGKVKRIAGITADITERRESAMALVKSQSRYRELFDNSPISLWEEDYSLVKKKIDSLMESGIPDLEEYLSLHPEQVIELASLVKIVDANKAALELYNLERNDVLLKALSHVLSQDALAHFQEEILGFMGDSKRFMWEGTDKLPDGQSKEVIVHGSIPHGYAEDWSKAIVSVSDITERKRVEQQLRQLSRAVEQSASTIIITDTAGKIEYVNPKFTEITGYTFEEALGHNPRMLKSGFTPGEVYEQLWQTIVSGKEWRGELLNKKKNDELYWEYVTISPIFNERGEITHFVGAKEDITQRKQSEVETQRHLTELEALYENGLAVGRLLTANEIGDRMINTFAKYLQWHHVTIRLRKKESEDLELVAFNLPSIIREQEKAETEQHFATLINKVGQGLSGWVVQTGRPVRTGNVHNNPQYVDTHVGIQSGLYMPLKVGERVIGVISVESETSDAFTEQDERLLATLANQAAIAFENAQLYTTLQKELSERKQMEQNLRASEVHYRELADSITDILFELDQHLHYTHWNRASEILTGFSSQEAIGKSIHEIFGESEEQTRISQIYEDVLKNHVSRTFETTLLLNGQKRSFEINAYPSTRGVSVVAKDVTERKQSEIIMQKRFELMEFSAHHSLDELMQKTTDEVSALTGSAIGFFHLMEEDQTTMSMQTWSTNALQLFHFPVSEGTHPLLDQSGLWAEAVRQRRPLIQNDYESIVKGKDLSQDPVLIMRQITIPIIRNERIMAVMGIANKPQDYSQRDLEIAEHLADYAWDITERKQMAVALEVERNQLAQRVDERTADLSRANSNLARALRVKDEFLANMSHELRTPLNAILGLSESLGEQIAGPLNEKQQKYIATIGESGHHLLSLINDILDLAKIDAGQITLDINKVDIHSVCQASLRMIKQLAQKKNQEVSLEIDEGLGLMWADERRLKQMIVNLLGNAVKFTPENGKLGLEVHGDEEANKISFTVWDRGIGIKEEDLARLFQPFVQLDSGLARETTGTGLGLALVAQMARLHGGSITTASEPENGSRFTIVLPWEPALALDAAARMKITGKFRAIKVDEKNKPIILLVEDTKEVTMMIRDYLELTGYKVVTAQDGVDAIVQAKLVRPDLILMDVQMPRMDGLEATRKLRSEPDFRYTPIIALTALAMPSDREHCLEAGMDEYISKPVNLKALVKIIQGCLFNNPEVKSQ